MSRGKYIIMVNVDIDQEESRKDYWIYDIIEHPTGNWEKYDRLVQQTVGGIAVREFDPNSNAYRIVPRPPKWAPKPL